MTMSRSAAEIPGDRVHIASQIEIKLREAVNTVCGQSHSHFPVDIAPLRVMVHPLCADGDSGHERNCAAEVRELEFTANCLAIERLPVRERSQKRCNLLRRQDLHTRIVTPYGP